MGLSSKEKEEYLKTRTEGYKEVLRQSPAFECASCRLQKHNPKEEAAGVWTYRTKDPVLNRQMLTREGLRIAQYVLCKECIETFEPKVIYQKVTAYLATQGLFDPEPPAKPKTETQRA
jgi:hypothetical protein